jgi:uncharacterized protein (DUF2249 family)
MNTQAQLERKAQMKGRVINGFKWVGYDNGKHLWQAEINGKLIAGECTEAQLHNGDIEYLTRHALEKYSK